MVRNLKFRSARYTLLKVMKIYRKNPHLELFIFGRWYAKRFLHPDVVSAYEYIFIWDEDLGVEHFNADR